MTFGQLVGGARTHYSYELFMEMRAEDEVFKTYKKGGWSLCACVCVCVCVCERERERERERESVCVCERVCGGGGVITDISLLWLMSFVALKLREVQIC